MQSCTPAIVLKFCAKSMPSLHPPGQLIILLINRAKLTSLAASIAAITLLAALTLKPGKTKELRL